MPYQTPGDKRWRGVNDIPNTTEGVGNSALEDLQIVTSPMAEGRQMTLEQGPGISLPTPANYQPKKEPQQYPIMAYGFQLSFLNDGWEIFKIFLKTILSLLLLTFFVNSRAGPAAWKGGARLGFHSLATLIFSCGDRRVELLCYHSLGLKSIYS